MYVLSLTYGGRMHLMYYVHARCNQNTRCTLIGINTTKLQTWYVCACVYLPEGVWSVRG